MSERPQSHDNRQKPQGEGTGGAQRRRVSSGALLGGARELIIEHNEREYRLRVTAQGKLILTA